MLQLPLEPANAFYSFTTSIEGVEYQFEIRWNGREGAWYFDLLDVDGDMIRAGCKIALGSIPGKRSADPRFPDGIFTVLDTSGAGVDATYDDIGVRVLLLYYTRAEITALVG